MAMDSDEIFFVFEHRLDSFQRPHPVAHGKATSAASRAPKALHWPHKALSPVALAKAGFFFEPHPKSPDNVVCFLCGKSLDGWEEGDNPVEEHLKHSPTCGWAIMAAIEAGYGNYGKVHPLDPAMVEARKATFAGRWPYESKKGFKCKTKKLVEGGWKYTPTLDADDMVTCAYCELALEGWESEDIPFDEHYKREPSCPFFALINQYPAPKKGKAKGARTSKASRLSVQSVATVATTASDLLSAADLTAEHDDSVMTTASTMTQGKKRTTARGGKATTGRGRKAKAKNDEPVEILEDEPQVEEPSKRGAARGRKRASDAMEDAATTNAEEPAPKKRATRVRGSAAADNSSIPDVEMVDAIPMKQPVAGKKARASTAKRSRKVSQASVSSQASTAPLRADAPDDDEIDRQLEADLERYETDVERERASVEKPPAPIRGRPKKAATARKPSTQRGKGQSESHAMFDPTPMVPDDAEIDAEFEALRVEVQVQQPAAPETVVVPKKGRKAAGTRKASKQTKKAKAPVAQSESVEQTVEGTSEPVQEFKQADEEVEEPKQEQAQEPVEDPDVSTGTVVTKPASRPSIEKRGRGRPSKKSTSSQVDTEQGKPDLYPVLPAPSVAQPEMARTRSSLVSAPKSTPGKIPRKPVPATSYYPPNSTRSPALAQKSGPVVPTPTKLERAHPGPPSSASRLPAPATPRARGTPLRRASQAVISPSQSPQSSDAENRPPALRPAASITSKRVALATVSQQTPLRNSPSRRNIVAGLQSTTPWQPADLDMLFSPTKSYEGADKENSVARLLRKGSELTSPEKRMTVEEWIYHNAGLAEQKLKHECETMVSTFEREGCRALSVLEGLIID